MFRYQIKFEPLFDQINIKKINLKPKKAAKDIQNYFDKKTKLKLNKNIFNANQNESNFKKDLSSLLEQNNHKVEGNWYLYNLNMRLPGHSRIEIYKFYMTKHYFLIGAMDVKYLIQKLLMINFN